MRETKIFDSTYSESNICKDYQEYRKTWEVQTTLEGKIEVMKRQIYEFIENHHIYRYTIFLDYPLKDPVVKMIEFLNLEF